MKPRQRGPFHPLSFNDPAAEVLFGYQGRRSCRSALASHQRWRPNIGRQQDTDLSKNTLTDEPTHHMMGITAYSFPFCSTRSGEGHMLFAA